MKFQNKYVFLLSYPILEEGARMWQFCCPPPPKIPPFFFLVFLCDEFRAPISTEFFLCVFSLCVCVAAGCFLRPVEALRGSILLVFVISVELRARAGQRGAHFFGDAVGVWC